VVAASAAGISERSARKWLGRWRTEGEAGLLDRSSAPRRIPNRTPEAIIEAIAALRRLRMLPWPSPAVARLNELQGNNLLGNYS